MSLKHLSKVPRALPFVLLILVGCGDRHPADGDATVDARLHSQDGPAALKTDHKAVRAWSRVAQIPADRTVLAVTHPSQRVMESFALLLDKEILKARDLLVLGIYNTQERASYKAARRIVSERKSGDMALLAVNCPVEKDDVLTDNRCSKTFEALFKAVDGFIFSGGPDIPPQLYHEEISLLTRVRAQERLYWEISLASHLLGGPNHTKPPLLEQKTKFFVLGICLGMQILNTAAGGTLVQDIPSELYGFSTWQQVAQAPEKSHRNPAYYADPHPSVWTGVFHPLKRIKAKDLWDQLVSEGDDIEVMSLHHQCVEKVGREFEIIATSRDGKVPEAMRHKKYPNVLALQFHPEYAAIWDENGLYRRFVGDKTKNAFYDELRRHPAWLSFHLKLWKVLSSRLERSASAHSFRNTKNTQLN